MRSSYILIVFIIIDNSGGSATTVAHKGGASGGSVWLQGQTVKISGKCNHPRHQRDFL